MPARMTEEEEYYTDMMEEVYTSPGQGPHTHKHNLRQRFELVRTLGEGTYGKVKLAITKDTKEQVAIKYIKKTKICDDTDLNRLRREIKILTSLNHPNIVNVQEVFENKDRIILVMDCATGGELYDYINKQHSLSEVDARRIFRQITSAMYYCHQNGVVHRDLKLENIVLDQDGNVKIADFGLSNYYAKDVMLSTFCGSPLYASPEIVNGRPYQGPEVDCWSMGVVLYTLVYGAMPFDSSDFKVLRRQITNGDYYEPARPSDAAGLIRHLLMVNPAKRATIENVLHHWWVNLGFRKTPNGDPYPSPEQLKPLRQNPSLSSDSEGEIEAKQNQPALKGILKKPKNGNRTREDTDSSVSKDTRQKSPLGPVNSSNATNYSNMSAMPEQSSEVFCNDTNSNSGDEIKKVFDSERKPARSILKRKGKFSGGDSGCVLNEGGAKSPSSDTKENMTYNLSDIDTVLCGADDTKSLPICRNEAADFVHTKNAQTSADGNMTVVPRRGILKKGSQSDSRKRLSTCSTGSNSSADILDFSYDSSDDNYLNMFRLSVTQNGELRSDQYPEAKNSEKVRLDEDHFSRPEHSNEPCEQVLASDGTKFYDSLPPRDSIPHPLQICQQL